MDNCVDLDPMEFLLDRRHPPFNTEKLVKSLVSDNKVVIFSKTSCPHCDDSKMLLSEMGVSYKSVELDTMKEGSQVQKKLGEITDALTVPRIFINGQCVGGNSDLKSLDASGRLKELLNNVNSEV